MIDMSYWKSRAAWELDVARLWFNRLVVCPLRGHYYKFGYFSGRMCLRCHTRRAGHLR